MIKLETVSYNDCTLGRLWIGRFRCFTLELPWLDNARNKSCIPAGIYSYFFRDSPKNGAILQLKDVPDRDYIQIHAGNYTSQIEGCVLVGDSIRYLNNDSIPDVTNSKETLRLLLAKAGAEGQIQIVRH